jgi:hypothetical protein
MKIPKKRFLTIFFSALFILLGVVGLFVYELFRIRPNNVHFTNVTSSSVTVSWNTKKAIPASVKVFEGDKVIPFSIYHSNDRFFDTRDVKEAELLAVQQTSNNIVEDDDLTVSIDDFQTDIEVTDMGEYYTHHVTVTGLDPETQYSFMVGDEYLFREVKDVNGNIAVSTLQTPEEIKSPVPAYGTVKDANNQEDISIDELSSVTDAVIYFNYLDEFTGERSSVYSSSFNSSGNWYIDVSNAVGEDGEHFTDRFGEEITNILVELVIDAGPLGEWKKVIDFDFISPTDLIVINDPFSLDDKEEGVLEIQSSVLDSFVQGVEASECMFSGFCGPCGKFEDGEFVQCTCPAKTLEYRKCGGESSTSLEESVRDNATAAADNAEAKEQGELSCSKGEPGDYTLVPGEGCKICDGTEGRWVKVDDQGECDGIGAFETRTPEVEPPAEEEGNGNSGVVSKMFYISGGNCIPIDLSKVPSAASSYLSDVTFYDSQSKCEDVLEGEENEEMNEGEPKCGSRNGKYYSAAMTNWVDGTNFCDVGEPNRTPNYPEPGETVYWYCKYNDQKEQCSATRKAGSSTITSTPETECWNSSNIFPLYRGSGWGREKCKDGKWVSAPQEETLNPAFRVSCEVGNICNVSGSHCVEVGGDRILVCSWPWHKWKVKSSTSEKAAINVVNVEKGQQCSHENGCICGNTMVVENSYCPEVSRCSVSVTSYAGQEAETPINEGKVCSTNPTKHTCQNGECKPAEVQGIQDQNRDQSILRNFVNEVNANSEEYVLDPATGMISDITDGVYIFEYQGESYVFEMEDDESVVIFIDKNSNGKYDEGGDVLVSDIASEINIVALEQRYDYELVQGLNFISLPFLISGEEYRTAAGLLTKLNEVYDDVFYSISKFDGRWKIVGQNVEVYDNNDFQLLPGEGYMIKAKEDINISIVGQPVQLETDEDKSPIYMTQGWNLIGLYGSSIKSYTAKTLIEDINEDNFTADNVTKWASDKQMYEGFQLSDGEEYGFDYPLNILESYFVRITEGKGNWQPSLSGNN